MVSEAERITGIPAHIVKLWHEDEGNDFITESAWVTDISAQDLPIFERVVSKYETKVLARLAVYKEPVPHTSYTMEIQHNEGFEFGSSKKYSMLHGSYLRLLEPFSSELGFPTRPKNTFSLLSDLFFVFGREVAIEKAYTSRISLPDLGRWKDSEGELVDRLGQQRDKSWLFQSGLRSGLSGSENFGLNPAAQELFVSSMETADIVNRYLLLWIALEVQVGKGAARAKFFEEEFGSVAISNFVKNTLRKPRDSYIHDGTRSVTSNHFAFLVALLRAASLPPSDFRRRLIMELQEITLEADKNGFEKCTLSAGWPFVDIVVNEFSSPELQAQVFSKQSGAG